MHKPGPRIVEEAAPIATPGFSGYVLRDAHVLHASPDSAEEQRIVEHVVCEVEALSGLIRTCVTDAANDDREFEWKIRASQPRP